MTEKQPEQLISESGLVGWRGYTFARPGFLTHSHSVLVPRQRAESFCPFHEDHLPPVEGCSCGFYAFKTLDKLVQDGYGTQSFLAEVYLWGKVVEHEHGYRAQYSYIKKLYSCQPKDKPYLAYIADIYGVPYDDTTGVKEPLPLGATQTTPRQKRLTQEDLWEIAFNPKVDKSTRRFARNQVRQRVWMKLNMRNEAKKRLNASFVRCCADIAQLSKQLEVIDELKKELDKTK